MHVSLAPFVVAAGASAQKPRLRRARGTGIFGLSRRAVVRVAASDEDSPGSSATAEEPTSSSSAYGGPNMYADSQAIAPPSPRRVFLGTLATAGLALGGNFLGITGKLLNGAPDVAEALRLDLIYPVGGFKRAYNPEKGYEFVYPEDCLGDATMVARAANQREAMNPLDPPALGDVPKPPKIFGQTVQEPQSAFGPMGGTGEENVSVIVSRSPPGGFKLDRFGDAQNQAEWLLANILAPPGSGKTSELFDAYTRTSGGGQKYFTFEYTIKTDAWYRHNVAVFTEKGGRLYTLVAQVPEVDWVRRRDEFRRVADSLKVFVPTG